MAKLATAWAIFQGLLLEAIPFLLMGVVIAGLARWLVPQRAWIGRLPKSPVLAPITGALMGFALPACECGNVPVARRLLASGAPMGTAFGFLFAAPVLNPIVLISTWAAFPDQPWLLIARPLGAFLLAILLSLLLVQLPETQLLETALLSERRMSQPLSHVGLLERSSGLIGSPLTDTTAQRPERLSFRTVLDQSSREFLDLLALLVLGCVIAALVQTWLPRSWLLAVGGALCLALGAVAPPSFMQHFIVFVLSVFIGFHVIWGVAHSLHTPLMAITNAISSIIIVGALLQIVSGSLLVMLLAALSVLMASVNIFGGFLVTRRMLAMFQRS